MLDSVKEILEKEVEIKQLKAFLVQEIEIKKLKELLATEIKLKEFLIQEIDIKKMFSSNGEAVVVQGLKVTDDKKTKQLTKISTEQDKGRHIMLPPYDRTLIDFLRDDCKEILFIHDEIMKYAAAKQYKSVATRLEYFSSKIKAYFHRADKELYCYLRTFIQQKYPKREKAFTELNLEMKNIAIEMFFSITQSPNIPVNDTNCKNFMREFNYLGELFDRRIHREETVLYVMYEESNEALSIS